MAFLFFFVGFSGLEVFELCTTLGWIGWKEGGAFVILSKILKSL